MNGTVREWLDKAEGDYQTARRELRAVESPNYDAVCFHAQQCVEKIMKALLIHHGVVPPRTHGLVQLYGLLNPHLQGWMCAEEDLRLVTQGAVAFRYPGEAADREDAAEILDTCARLREQLLKFVPEERERGEQGETG